MDELLAGLQIHRVLSYDKLFCRCKYNTAVPSKDSFKVWFPRSNLSHKYLYNHLSCRYQQEKAYPMVSEKILKKAATLVLALGATLVDKLYFCRKMILDNSIPKGYQITGIIGLGGFIKLKNKIVEIDKIYLEEDSCSKNSEGYYEVSRCGIPLLEITTKPTFLKEEQIIELSKEIERILSSFFNIPTKPGTIRQDINLSKGDNSSRVEFKGCDTLQFKNWLYNHYLSLEKYGTRKLDCENKTSYFLRELSGHSRLWPESEVPILTINKKLSMKILRTYEPTTSEFKFKNKNICKRFSKYTKDLDLSEKRKSYFLYEKYKSLSYVKSYLEDLYSYHSLMEGTPEPCYDLKEAIRLYNIYENKKTFFTAHRLRLPRSFSKWVKINK